MIYTSLLPDDIHSSNDPARSHWFFLDSSVAYLRVARSMPQGGNKREEDYSGVLTRCTPGKSITETTRFETVQLNKFFPCYICMYLMFDICYIMNFLNTA